MFVKDVSVVSARSYLTDVCSSVSDQFGLNQLFDDIKSGGDVRITTAQTVNNVITTSGDKSSLFIVTYLKLFKNV